MSGKVLRPVEPTEKAIRVVAAEPFKNFHKDATKLADRISEVSGDLGKLVAEAVEKKHLNKKAYAFIKSLDRIEEPEKLAAVLANFDQMRKILKLDERAALQGRLFPDGEKAEEDADGADDGKDLRPRQPDASAASAEATTARTVEEIREAALGKVGRGQQHKPH